MTTRGSKAGQTQHTLDERTPLLNDKQIRRSATKRTQAAQRLSEGKFPGRVVDNRGYARIKVSCHPRRDTNTRYVYEHIVVAEWCLGRPLDAEEVVHHLDEDKSNSHYSNLVVFPTQGRHMRFHSAIRHGLVPDRASVLLFDGTPCKRPALSKGGPYWIQGLRERILGGLNHD